MSHYLCEQRFVAFQLQIGEELTDGLHRIIHEQLVGSIEALSAAKGRQRGVHEARKCFKRVRGALRLVRDELGEESFAAHNARLRDAGRLLSEVRDSWVFVEAVDALSERFAHVLAPDAFAPVRDRLVERHEAISREILGRRRTAAQVVGQVEEALREGIPGKPVRDGFAAIEGGLLRVYQRGYRCREKVAREPSVRALHEWRKRVKYLRSHCEILQPIWPGVLSALYDQTDALGELLGVDHDLAELGRTLTAEPALCDDPVRSAVLRGLVDLRRSEIQAEAMPLGARLYAEEPPDYVQRMRAYWEAWASDPAPVRPASIEQPSPSAPGSVPEVVAEIHRLSMSIREILEGAEPRAAASDSSRQRRAGDRRTARTRSTDSSSSSSTPRPPGDVSWSQSS